MAHGASATGGASEPRRRRPNGTRRECHLAAERLLYPARMAALADTALMTLSTDATDPRARGLAAGSALAEPAGALPGRVPAAVRERWARHRRRAALRCARARARRELAPTARGGARGVRARGAGSSPSWSAALNARTELLALAECTTVGRCESAEGPWLAQNWDWYADGDPERCLVWSAAVEGARFATMTEAGILAKVGVSTRGIAVALNILYHASDGRGELGVPVHLVLRRLLEEAASTVDAWELLRETPYSASSCVTVVDAGGDGACFELSPAGVARIEPRDGLLAHSNHFLDDALAGGEAEQPAAWLPGSRGRLATAQRAGAARPRRGARRARRPRVGSAADLPPCRGSRSARPAAGRHGRVARHAPGSPGVARGRRTPVRVRLLALRGLTGRQAPGRAHLRRHCRAVRTGGAEIAPARVAAPAEALDDDRAARVSKPSPAPRARRHASPRAVPAGGRHVHRGARVRRPSAPPASEPSADSPRARDRRGRR